MRDIIYIEKGERLRRLKVDGPFKWEDVREDLADAMPGGRLTEG